MAIISKAIFEKTAGKSPALGSQLGLDRYVSTNKGLAPLAGGGRLFIVTVRPPDEALWLVAVLDNPTFTGTEWLAAACTTPMTEISALKSQLVFDSGKGLPNKPGTLGMSLQTPRVLTAADAALLVGALGDGASPTAPAAARDPEQALRAAVLAAPHDEAPRAVLLDHWRHTGNPRGQLIDLELALRGKLSIPTRKELAGKRARLHREHARTWWPWPVELRIRDGFAWGVRSDDAAAWLEHADAVLAQEPVIEVSLREVDEETCGELAKARWLARIESLVLRGPVGDDGFAALCKSKHTGKLRRLNVSGNEITSDGLAALKSAFPALETLVLTGNAFGDDGAAALARWKHLGGLRTLYLSRCELTSDGVRSLVTKTDLARLTKLTLSNNELADDGVAELAAAAGWLPQLAYLELASVELGEEGSASLAHAAFPLLGHLDVSNNPDTNYDVLRASYPRAKLY